MSLAPGTVFWVVDKLFAHQDKPSWRSISFFLSIPLQLTWTRQRHTAMLCRRQYSSTSVESTLPESRQVPKLKLAPHSHSVPVSPSLLQLQSPCLLDLASLTWMVVTAASAWASRPFSTTPECAVKVSRLSDRWQTRNAGDPEPKSSWALFSPHSVICCPPLYLASFDQGKHLD